MTVPIGTASRNFTLPSTRVIERQAAGDSTAGEEIPNLANRADRNPAGFRQASPTTAKTLQPCRFANAG